jgi:phosphoglycolate phosphatase
MVDPFSLVLGGDSLAQRKPDPAPLLRAAELLELAPERTVMVGDSELDIQAARAAGICCCAVTWGLRGAEHLARLDPQCLVESPEALETCLRKHLCL